MTEAVIITKSEIAVDFADFAMTIPRPSQAGRMVEPNLFLALSQIVTASPDHGGGKRRVVICRLAAKPPGCDNRRLCLVPLRAAWAAMPMRTRQRWVSDQHRGETPKVRLRTSIRSRWHLSHLFWRLSVSRGFDRWGSGEQKENRRAAGWLPGEVCG
jgi:hypothetical protein